MVVSEGSPLTTVGPARSTDLQSICDFACGAT